jgi:hypothetical protein
MGFYRLIGELKEYRLQENIDIRCINLMKILSIGNEMKKEADQ